MLHLHRISRAAPLVLVIACGTPTENTTDPSGTSSGESSSSEGPPPDPTTTTATTAAESTGDTTTSGTTEVTATTAATEDTTTGGALMCETTIDCEKGESCWAVFDGEMGPFTCHAECVDDMGGGNSESQWCADDFACCTPGAVCDEEGYCVAGGDTDTTGTETGTETDTGTGTETDTGTTGDTDTDTDTGGVLPSITIEGLQVTADCMPIVPDDPIVAAWTTKFDNTGGAVEFTADVTKATLTYSPGNGEFVQEIKVSPTTSGVVGVDKIVSKDMKKTGAITALPDDCGQCGKPVALEIVFDVDGADVAASAEVELQCVF
jgi:hypothetical protein